MFYDYLPISFLFKEKKSSHQNQYFSVKQNDTKDGFNSFTSETFQQNKNEKMNNSKTANDFLQCKTQRKPSLKSKERQNQSIKLLKRKQTHSLKKKQLNSTLSNEENNVFVKYSSHVQKRRPNHFQREKSNLSQQTLDMMNFLQSNKCCSHEQRDLNDLFASGAISKCPMRIKYQELLDYKRQTMLLPLQYKELLIAFKYIDSFISQSKQNMTKGTNNKMVMFDSILVTQSRNDYPLISMTTLYQLLYLVPQLYVIKIDNGTLYIDIPNDYFKKMTKNAIENDDYQRRIYDYITTFQKDNRITCQLNLNQIQMRSNFLKEKLIQKTKEAHDAFLINELEIEVHRFDPFKYKTWNHTFRLNACAETIPMIDIDYFVNEDKVRLKEFMIELKKISMSSQESSIHITNLINILKGNEGFCSKYKGNLSFEKLKQLIINSSVLDPNLIKLRTEKIFGVYVEFPYLLNKQ